MEKNKWMKAAALMMVLVMAVSMAACGKKTEDKPEEEQPKTEEPVETEKQEETAETEEPRVDLTDDEIDMLVSNAANDSVEVQYAEYFELDDLFANAEVFGVDRDSDNGKLYAYMNYGEYVVANDKAYEASGGAGEVIIHFTYDGDEVDYGKVEWSADGSDHDKWLEDNYPEEYLKKDKEYDPYDENGKSKLSKALAEDVEKEFGVPVDTENIIEIDTENWSYKILKTIESGDPADDTYKFDTEVVEEGDLELAED
ncbi:MAG: hypothetical protein IJH41_02940 [Eubacterium sp.]|nr:hypothetical protein [Eubacterium sp.]